MRMIEVRRHAYTKKGEGRGKGSHLSAAGVALARKLGNSMGPFDRVLTSQVPRTLETALAMGFAVDDQLVALGEISPAAYAEIGHHERWGWEQPFVRFAELVAQGGATAELGHAQRQTWVAALESVSATGRVLVISHGRILETGLVTCLPGGDFAAWGKPFQHGEGVRLGYEQGKFTVVEWLRGEG
jgi:broad specificity phosphatase PhoE